MAKKETKKFVVVDVEWDADPQTLEEAKQSVQEMLNHGADLENIRIAEIKFHPRGGKLIFDVV